MSDAKQADFRLAQADRVAARAVVVPDGEPAMPHLLKAGILEPIRLQFRNASEGGAASSMADGAIRAMEATLELDNEVETAGRDEQQADVPDATGGGMAEEEADRRTVNLPEAFGRQPLAPVWRSR